jgi:hypothetical protein
LEAIDVFNLLGIVEMAEIETFDNSAWRKFSHIASDLNVDPFSSFGDIIEEDPAGVLVERRFDFVVVFAVGSIAIQNFEFPLVLAE